MCGGGGGSDDGSDAALEIDARERKAERQERRRDKKADAAEKLKDEAALEKALAGGRSGIEAYFQEQGVNPNEYATTNNAVINEILNRIPAGADDPGTYWEGSPQYAFDRAENVAQGNAMRDVDRVFAPNFEYTRYADTADDAILASILAEGRGEAEDYLQNLLARGVINDSGMTAGTKNIDKQAAQVKALLDQYGSATIEGGRAEGRDVANRARTAAGGYKLGSPAFNAGTYGTELDAKFADFLSGLETDIRGKITTPNLFDTSGLAMISGGGQGAGNLAYDRRATSGLPPVEDDEEEELNRISGSAGLF